ncbi:MAG: hypothetical protein HC851_13990 [Acaryochloris sp. RU_4_1]|nr:hypothetical protein [Acaryochloris sp. SU_5_25]NJM66682.1 hypothetical protein [Acaryochloris sp. RU_4_1]NJN39066.1 hypothetical protein [Acaryochloridaceae cyanobacterium CSU_3_4]NJR54772.1 hypothetical protein [Acaryochloris sp. CRU_2_0]
MVLQLWFEYYPILQPLFVGICFCLAWGIIGLLVWNLGSAIAYSIRTSQRMHQIPCSRCRYFTNDSHLKCPVRPDIALSEAAISCGDFAPPPSLTLEI